MNRALPILLTGTFMSALDASIVNVAAPTIREDLGASNGTIQLIISGYVVAYAALLITGARVGDDRGHRTVFLAGLAGFTLSSALCGFAWSPAVLIAARLAQGVSAAAMAPQVITIIGLRLDGEHRSRALALFAAIVAGGVVAGQVLGGAIVDANVAGSAWRPIFLINVPVGIVLWIAGRRGLPNTRLPAAAPLDLLGAAGLAATVGLLLVPIEFGHQSGWAWWTWALLGAAAVSGGALVAHLRRRGPTGAPLLDLVLLTYPVVRSGLLAIAAQTAAWGGLLFVLSVHVQQALGFSPLHSGLTLVPFAFAFAVGSLRAARLPVARARVAVTAGLLVLAGGYGALAALLHDDAKPGVTVAMVLITAGFAFGVGYGPVLGRLVGAVPSDRARDVSGMFTTVNQLAFALGVAVLGSLYSSRLGHAGSAAASALGTTLIACAVLSVIAALASVAMTAAERRL